MKKYTFEISASFTEEMKRKLDATNYNYTATPMMDKIEMFEFEIEIENSEDVEFIEHLESQIF